MITHLISQTTAIVLQSTSMNAGIDNIFQQRLRKRLENVIGYAT
jgi:hypothetical protein